MDDIQRFLTGFRVFQKDYFGPQSDHFEPLKHGQSPKTMIIGCSDSRVDPALLTNSAPGDIFMVRNVANLVPPFESDGGQHGVSAALEFAVTILEVEHIIVLGHSQCGGINALMNGNCEARGGSFISRWMSIAAPARDRIRTELAEKDAAHLLRGAVLVPGQAAARFAARQAGVERGQCRLQPHDGDDRAGDGGRSRGSVGGHSSL